MRAINHAMTGAAIGLAVANPGIAVPVALLSHFVLDAVPHYSDEDKFSIGTKIFSTVLVLDALLCVVLVGLLYVVSPMNWFVPAACAFLATSPDFLWIPRFLVTMRTGIDPGENSTIEKFHAWIQWKAWPTGYWVECGWFVSMFFALSKLVG